MHGWRCILRSKLSIWLLYGLFLREELSITNGRIFATVIFDNRPCKLRTHKRLRVKCADCPGAPGNRWSCVNERIVMEHILSAGTPQNADSSAPSAESDASDDEYAAAAHISKYSSILPRRFFPCKSEDAATVDLYGEILEWNRTSQGERQDPFPFVGIDMNTWCRQNYIKGHSPGIFTVLCTCRHPILIGFSVMLQNEGISTALSVLLSRLQRLPRVCYYDNSCNMMRTATLMTPWVARKCLIVCDRFHYRQHSCNSVHDPDSYASCKNHASSGAESVKNLFSFSR